ncbi:MAG: Cys-Gln thioester bond-forming surface protein [Streptococcaceae bacterium]|jgi:LPXTG-motif cell wall-anchored protein|nr:Cys-Gln thioester bond-forming surface protein [Streptococcaceae bacterium]
MKVNIKKQQLKQSLTEPSPTNFRQWKSGKQWLYGLCIALAFLGATATISSFIFQSETVYALGNGTVSSVPGILLNSGARENGNPQGRVYCIDQKVFQGGGSTATIDPSKSTVWNSFNTTQKSQVQAIAWYSFNNDKLSAANESDSNMYLAAQALIWDITSYGSLPVNGASSQTGLNHDWGDSVNNIFYPSAAGYNQAAMIQDMDYLLSLYHGSQLLPQFNPESQRIHLGQTASFTDTNNVLNNYPQISATNGLQASTTGNLLNVIGTQAGVGTVTLSNGGLSPDIDSQGVAVWLTSNPAGQDLILAKGTPLQQTKVSVTVIPTASLKISKTDTDRNKPIPGAVYVGLNKEGQIVTKDADGNNLPNTGRFITGDDGSFTVNNLMDDPNNVVGGESQTIVTLREMSVPSPYTLSADLPSVVNENGDVNSISMDLPVSLVAGTTASNPTGVTFSDKAQVQAIKVQKTATLSGKKISNFPNDNYSLKDTEFTLRNVTQGTTLGKIYTDKNGLADLSSLIKTGDSHQSAAAYQAILNQLLANGDSYSIQETIAPNGLACDWNDGKPQNFSLSNTGTDTQLINPTVKDTSAENTDTPITVASTLTKIDSDTGTAQTQGSAHLQGTIESLFYRKDIKDRSGNIIHKANTAVAWSDGFSELPIAISSGKKADNKFVSLQVANGVNTVGVKNLPITENSSEEGYYWAEKSAGGALTPGFGYTDNTSNFNIQSGEGADGTSPTSGVSVINSTDTNLTQSDHVLTVQLEFIKAFNNDGSLTGEDGAEFSISPSDKSTLAILDGLNAQNSHSTSGDSTSFDGYTMAGLSRFKFPIGNYTIHQTKTAKGTKPIQDIKVSFSPNASTNGAPSSYTLTINWADGTKIYSKTFKSDDFTDDNSNLIKFNLGTLSDNKLVSSIKTTASDSLDNDHNLGLGTVTARDNSIVKNLVAGDYTEVTHWVDKSTGKEITINGKALTTSKDFSSTGDGEDEVKTEVTFDDVSLQGKEITAEEFIYPKGNTSGTPVISETNYKTNEDQSLTVATGKGETQVQTSVIKNDTVTINDQFKGSGFQPNETVLVKVDSAYDHSQDKEVSASGQAKFTADSNGNIQGLIQVTVDATELQDHDLTFFESTFLKDELVFKLHDKNASSETVHVSLPTDTPSSGQNLINTVKNAILPHTGDLSSWLPLALGASLLATVLAFIKRQTVIKAFHSLREKLGKK